MTRADFEALVAEIGLSSVPEKFRDRLRNVEFFVEGEPSEEVRKEEGLGPEETLLGLYQGIPHTERGEEYGVGITLPDTITLYQKPIEEAAEGNPQRIRKEIADTIWHEVAHHFGLEHDRIEAQEKSRMQQIIIGITGTLGAGKGTVVEYLKNKGFKHFSVSGFLNSEIVKRGLVPDRVKQREVANEYRAKGPLTLMEAVYESAKTAIEAGENVVIESQHTAAEVRFIQSMGGVELIVDADLRTRYARITKRGSEKDNVTFEQFSKEQEWEMSQKDPNMNNLGSAIAIADFHISNDGTLEDLYRQVDEVLVKIHAHS